ncbi:hypothetical protein C8F04DRAFT_1112788 [Mycena alexandri]|uniref:Short-chain dehydrogenase/reductase family protein n=1 Tax=Mycena alexandri TaxID=1745969 RepID=A0AAD6WZW5_9AGAR|nr:hypothetical protein C8F04DRAFT_1112788 [Mycena alexandri]
MGVLAQLNYLLFSFLPDQLFSKLPAIHADLTGRTVVVTGSNTGLGLSTAIHFARMNPVRLILAVRDLKKGIAAKEEIISETGFAGRLEVWELDMADFGSVKRFVEQANTTLERLDSVILSTGINVPSWDITVDGWEKTFQVNMLATGLLGVLLLPLLKKTAKTPLPDVPSMAPHLTITGSGSQYLALFPEKDAPEILKALNDESKSIKRDRYPTSKLLVILYARAMAELTAAEGVIINVSDPGLCISSIGSEYNLGAFAMFLIRRIAWSTTKGSLNLVYAALKPTPSGSYISSCELRPTVPWSTSKDGLRVQRKMWNEMVEVWCAASPDVADIVGI